MGVVTALLVALVAFLILFVLYRVFRRYRPVIVFNPSGEIVDIVNVARGPGKTLSKPYAPTPWLVGRHLRSMWGLRFRGIAPIARRYQRERVDFADGGHLMCDLAGMENSDAPLVFMIHSLTGNTREPCMSWMASAVVRHGWRVVGINCRGCGGGTFTSDKYFSALEPDDFLVVIAKFKAELAPPRMFLVGFSLGGIQALQVAMNCDDIAGYAAVSQTYDTTRAIKCLETPLATKLYGVMVTRLRNGLRRNPYLSEQDKRATRAKTLAEFDDLYTALKLGFRDHHEYYAHLNTRDKIGKVRAPTLVLGADDDPMTLKDCQPLREVAQTARAVMVTYPEGGHLGFNFGRDGKKSLVEGIVIDWFEAIIAVGSAPV